MAPALSKSASKTKASIRGKSKTQEPTAAGGLFTKDRFDVNVGAGTVTCPNGVTVKITRHRRGGGMAYFKEACRDCPLRDQCTTSTKGRTIAINAHEEALARARARQRDPVWRADCTATRPKVERKLADLMRRRHGGRRATRPRHREASTPTSGCSPPRPTWHALVSSESDGVPRGGPLGQPEGDQYAPVGSGGSHSGTDGSGGELFTVALPSFTYARTFAGAALRICSPGESTDSHHPPNEASLGPPRTTHR